MPDYEPEKKELASRDVVSRRMEEHIRLGRAVQTRHGVHLWLDITLLGADHIHRRLREVYEISKYFLGIDPAKDWIPVRPAQHYSMGGIRTGLDGHSPHLRGLFACGEAACWDLHGFNRLGGNSVAETVVAGMIVGETIADWCASAASADEVPIGLVREHHARVQAELEALQDGAGGDSPTALMAQMQRLMTDQVCVFRSGPTLQMAVDELGDLLRRSRRLRVPRAPGANPALADAYRVQKMLKLALCVAAGALARTESRGAHFREDYPRRNDRDWLKRTLAFWPQADGEGPVLDYETQDVMRMELPPGWRGYGAKDHVDHPDAPRRQAEVDAARVQLAGAERHEVQARLMPFLDLLPAALRGRNERLAEPVT
jgi:fumarate reductase flavoprotein subunit